MDLRSAREILGVTESSTKEEIRRAYVRKIKVHKPEVEPEKFAEVRRAYELLSSTNVIIIMETASSGLSPLSFLPRPLGDSASAQSHLNRVFGSCARGELDEAVAAAEDALAAMREEKGPPFGAVDLLELIASLHAVGRSNAASALTVSLEELIEATESEAAVFSGEDAIRWTILQDLDRLDGLPEALRRTIAESVRARTLDGLRGEYFRVLSTLGTGVRRRAREALDGSRMLGALLAREHPPPLHSQSRGGPAVWLLVMMALFGSHVLIRFGACPRKQERTLPRPELHNNLAVMPRGTLESLLCSRPDAEQPCVSLGILRTALVTCPQLVHARKVLEPYSVGPLRSELLREDERAAADLDQIVAGLAEMIASYHCEP